MAVAPLQLWLDGPAITLAVRAASTVTVTTSAYHGLSTGSYVQVAGFTGSVGSTCNGVFQVTNTSGTTFTYTAAGNAGTAVTSASLTTEYFSHDLLNPLVNYSGTARNSALYVPLESLNATFSGDGEAGSIGFTVIQDETQNNSPWYLSIPDQTRIRLVKANTGDTPGAGQTLFRGYLQGVSAMLTGSGLGTIADVTGDDVNGVLDRVVIFGTVK